MIWLTLLACNGDGPDAPTPQITGEISTPDGTADVSIYKAFAFHADNQAVFYLVSTPDADCPSVAHYLSAQQVDPVDIWDPGTCNLSAVLPSAYDTSGVTLVQTTDESSWDVTWSVRCALGEGSFEWGKRDEASEDEDYFWTGDAAYEWIGHAQEFDVSFSGTGTADDPYFVDIVSMEQLSGNYPSILGAVPAEGSISGSIEAVSCNDLYGAYIFP